MGLFCVNLGFTCTVARMCLAGSHPGTEFQPTSLSEPRLEKAIIHEPILERLSRSCTSTSVGAPLIVWCARNGQQCARLPSLTTGDVPLDAGLRHRSVGMHIPGRICQAHPPRSQTTFRSARAFIQSCYITNKDPLAVKQLQRYFSMRCRRESGLIPFRIPWSDRDVASQSPINGRRPAAGIEPTIFIITLACFKPPRGCETDNAL